jgi:hypothetical protein
MFASQGFSPHLTGHLRAGEITRAEMRDIGASVFVRKLHKPQVVDIPLNEGGDDLSENVEVLILRHGAEGFQAFVKNGSGEYHTVPVKVVDI